jgi:hypothetical protein
MQTLIEKTATRHRRTVFVVGSFLGTYEQRMLKEAVETRDMRFYTIAFDAPTWRELLSADQRRLRVLDLRDKIAALAKEVGTIRPSIVADGFSCWALCEILQHDVHLLFDKMIFSRSLASEEMRWSKTESTDTSRVLKVLNLTDRATLYPMLPNVLFRRCGLGRSGVNGFVNHGFGAPHGTSRSFIQSVSKASLGNSRSEALADALVDWSMPELDLGAFEWRVREAEYTFCQAVQVEPDEIKLIWLSVRRGANGVPTFSRVRLVVDLRAPCDDPARGVSDQANDSYGVFTCVRTRRPVLVRTAMTVDGVMATDRLCASVPIQHPADGAVLGVLSMNGDASHFAHLSDADLLARLSDLVREFTDGYASNPCGA